MTKNSYMQNAASRESKEDDARTGPSASSSSSSFVGSPTSSMSEGDIVADASAQPSIAMAHVSPHGHRGVSPLPAALSESSDDCCSSESTWPSPGAIETQELQPEVAGPRSYRDALLQSRRPHTSIRDLHTDILAVCVEFLPFCYLLQMRLVSRQCRDATEERHHGCAILRRSFHTYRCSGCIRRTWWTSSDQWTPCYKCFDQIHPHPSYDNWAKYGVWHRRLLQTIIRTGSDTEFSLVLLEYGANNKGQYYYSEEGDGGSYEVSQYVHNYGTSFHHRILASARGEPCSPIRVRNVLGVNWRGVRKPVNRDDHDN